MRNFILMAVFVIMGQCYVPHAAANTPVHASILPQTGIVDVYIGLASIDIIIEATLEVTLQITDTGGNAMFARKAGPIAFISVPTTSWVTGYYKISVPELNYQKTVFISNR